MQSSKIETSAELQPRVMKTRQMKLALGTGDSTLIAQAINSLCGLEDKQPFASVMGNEANIIATAAHIYFLNQKVQALKAEKQKSNYDASFFVDSTANMKENALEILANSP